MNKTVLITGASSGIGEGCARKFASQGARLILNARNAQKLESLASELTEKYGIDGSRLNVQSKVVAKPADPALSRAVTISF